MFLLGYFLKRFQLKLFLFKYLLFLFLFNANYLFCQNETNNWYFGKNVGLNFANGEVLKLEDGAMNTPAGCASISDANGDLLFYTNGSSVWGMNHQIISNGDGLAGDVLGVQTSIIIPKPNDSNTYYIFTTRESDSSSPIFFSKGVYYSEIKFTNDFPLGVVVSKNIKITNTSYSRIGAIHHPETNSIRLICMTQSNNGSSNSPSSIQSAFNVFVISENGINIDPVISVINESLGAVGAMKISPDGKFVAFADRTNQKVYFYNYDNNAITFNRYITLPTVPAFGLFLDPYGIEFSQDSKIFYYSGNDYVVQFPFFEMGGPEPVDYYIFNVKNPSSLQLARNGKIYVVQENSNRIAVINSPEKKGVDCDFQPGVIEYNNSIVKKGLPVFIASSLRNRIISAENSCVNTAFNFDLDTYENVLSVQWDFGDGTFSSDLNPNHIFSAPGSYEIKVKVFVENRDFFLFKNVEVYSLPNLELNSVLSQCVVNNEIPVIFNLYNIKDFTDDANSDYSFSFYNSYFDAINNENVISNPELYESTSVHEEVFVRITSATKCITIGSFFLDNYSTAMFQLDDIYTCENSDGIINNSEGQFNLDLKEINIRAQLDLPSNFRIQFYLSYQDAQTKINVLNNSYVGETTNLWIRIEDENYNCFGIASFKVIVNSNVEPDLESQYIICDSTMQSTVVLDGGEVNEIWQWRDENDVILSTSRYFELAQAGNYSLKVYRTENDLQCSASKGFKVVEAKTAFVNNILADDGQIFISVTGESIYEFSLDGINYFGEGYSYMFDNVLPGIHNVFIKDVYNCEKIIIVKIHLIKIPQFFTPNGDGVNDFWRIFELTDEFYSRADIQIFDRYGKSIYNMNLSQNYNGWDGTFQNQKLPATDYWYRIVLIDSSQKEIIKSGHFSLKR